MYFDTSYIAKFYLNEPDSPRVREIVRHADAIHSSVLALVEFHAVLHRQMREQTITPAAARNLASLFAGHAEQGLWHLMPVGEGLLRRTATRMLSAPRHLFLRTADAVHLMSAKEAGEREIWTNDRHMLAAASYFGLSGRSV